MTATPQSPTARNPIAASLALALSAIFLSGCALAPPAPSFNARYLPNVSPASPPKRLEIPESLKDRFVVTRKELFGEKQYLLTYFVDWTERDNLLLVSDGRDPYVFLVVPSSDEITLLKGAEREAVLSKWRKNVSCESAETHGGQIGKGIASLFTNKEKLAYVGKVENNGFSLDFEMNDVTEYEGITGKGLLASQKVKARYVEYTATNSQNGDKLAGTHSGYGYADRTGWLQTWKISPGGDYYMNGAHLFSPRNKISEPLTFNFRCMSACPNPEWTSMAFLVARQGPNKEWRIAIEYYPLQIAGMKR